MFTSAAHVNASVPAHSSVSRLHPITKLSLTALGALSILAASPMLVEGSTSSSLLRLQNATHSHVALPNPRSLVHLQNLEVHGGVPSGASSLCDGKLVGCDEAYVIDTVTDHVLSRCTRNIDTSGPNQDSGAREQMRTCFPATKGCEIVRDAWVSDNNTSTDTHAITASSMPMVWLCHHGVCR